MLRQCAEYYASVKLMEDKTSESAEEAKQCAVNVNTS